MVRLLPLCIALAAVCRFAEPEGIPVKDSRLVRVEGGGRVSTSQPHSLRGGECKSDEQTTFRSHGKATHDECLMLTAVMGGACEGLEYAAMSTGS